MDFTWQPVLTCSVVGPRRSSKALSKAKLLPEKGHGHYLVVCCLSDPLQRSESQQNHYIWEACSANRWGTLKTAASAASVGQQTGPNSSLWQCWPHVITRNWVMKFCLICYIQLTSCQLITISSIISTTFCRENTSTTSRRQKIRSKSSSNPEAQIFIPYRNEQTYCNGSCFD